MEKLVQALAKAQAAMKNAALNKENPHFRSKYADLATIRDAVVPFLAKEGIACVQTIERGETGYIVKTSLLHGTARLDSECPIMVAQNAGAQQFGSALTYARRYSLAAIAGIAAEEDDDGNSAQGSPPKGQENRPAQQRKDPPPSQDATGTPFDDAPRADLCVPVPLDAEASGSDWKLWATTLLPDRLRVCRNADEVDGVVKANLDALNTLKGVSPQAHKALMNSATKRAEFFIEKEAA